MCHSAETKPAGSLRVDDRNGLLVGGNSGAAVVPGYAAASLLLNRVSQDGRDHNITGYAMWLGGAASSGDSHTGPLTSTAGTVEGRMHTNDLHATLLALLGLDHRQLMTYPYAGRDFR